MHTGTHICNKWGELWLQLPLPVLLQAGRSCSLAFAVTERPIGVLAKMLSNNIYKHTYTYTSACVRVCCVSLRVLRSLSSATLKSVLDAEGIMDWHVKFIAYLLGTPLFVPLLTLSFSLSLSAWPPLL